MEKGIISAVKRVEFVRGRMSYITLKVSKISLYSMCMPI
jgi:hypothetical protein